MTSGNTAEAACESIADAARDLLRWGDGPDRGSVAIVTPDDLAIETQDELIRSLRKRGFSASAVRWPVALCRRFLDLHEHQIDRGGASERGAFIGRVLTIRFQENRVEAVMVRLLALPDEPSNGPRSQILPDRPRLVPARDRSQDMVFQESIDALDGPASYERRLKLRLGGQPGKPPQIGAMSKAAARSVIERAIESTDDFPIGLAVVGESVEVSGWIEEVLEDHADRAEWPICLFAGTSDGSLATGARLLQVDEFSGLIPFFENVPSIEILGHRQKPTKGFVVRVQHESYWVNLLRGLETTYGSSAWLAAGVPLEHSPIGLGKLTVPVGSSARFKVVFEQAVDPRVWVLEVPIDRPAGRTGRDVGDKEEVQITVAYRVGRGRPIVRIEWKRRELGLPSIELDWATMQPAGEKRNDISLLTWEEVEARRR